MDSRRDERLALALGRRAEVGDMATAFLHELASVLQALYGAVTGIEASLPDGDSRDPTLARSLDDARTECAHALALYRAVRAYCYGQDRDVQPFDLAWAAKRARRLCGPSVRGRARLRVELETVYVNANRVLAIQLATAMIHAALDGADRDHSIALRCRPGEGGGVLEVDFGRDADVRIGRLDELEPADGDEIPAGFELACAAVIADKAGGALAVERGPTTVLRATFPAVDR